MTPVSIEFIPFMRTSTYANHRDVRRTRSLRPSTSVVNESLQYKFAGLVRWCSSQNSDDKGSSSNRMPPNRDIVEMMQDLDTKCVDDTCKNGIRWRVQV